MHIDESDTNLLLEILANRGVEVRPLPEYSMTELNNEITRRRMEAERTEIGMAEIYAEAQHESEMARAESEACAEAEAEAIAEDNARADQERAEAEAYAEGK